MGGHSFVGMGEGEQWEPLNTLEKNKTKTFLYANVIANTCVMALALETTARAEFQVIL